MAYTKTNWVDNSPPYIEAANLNHAEQGIYEAHTGPGIVNGMSPSNSASANSTALQAAHDAVVATGQPGVLSLLPGTYPISGGMTWNFHYVSLEGNGATLDASSVTTGSVFTLTGTVDPPYGQNRLYWANLLIQGNGTGGSVIGLNFTTPTPTAGEGASSVRLDGVAIKQFGTGVRLYTNSYLLEFDECQIFQCGVAWDCPSGGTNYGERISFSGGTIFNNTIGIRSDNWGTDVFLVNSSLDYNARHVDLGQGVVGLVNCHVENYNTATQAPFILRNTFSQLYISSGRIWIQNNGTLAMPAVFDCPAGSFSPLGGIWMRGTSLYNAQTTSGKLISGSGSFSYEDRFFYSMGSTALPERRSYLTKWYMAGDFTVFHDSAPVIDWSADLTANQTVTLDTASALPGDWFRIARSGAGNFSLNVGPNIKTLMPRQYVDVIWDGSFWNVCGEGTLEGTNSRVAAAQTSIASSAQIAINAANTIYPVSATANVTGITMPQGNYDAQRVILENRSAFSLTFNTTPSTSLVADGTADIPPSRALELVWDANYGGTGVGRWVIASAVPDSTSALSVASLTASGQIAGATGVLNYGAALGYPMSVQANSNVTPVTAAAASSAAQNLMSYSVPAGLLNVVGRALRVRGAGVYSTQGTAPTITLTLTLGGTTIATFGAATAIASTSNAPWDFEVVLSTVSAGASATLEVHGAWRPRLSTTNAAAAAWLDANTAVSSAIDLTAAKILQVQWTYSNSSISNSVTQRQMVALLAG